MGRIVHLGSKFWRELNVERKRSRTRIRRRTEKEESLGLSLGAMTSDTRERSSFCLPQMSASAQSQCKEERSRTSHSNLKVSSCFQFLLWSFAVTRISLQELPPLIPPLCALSPQIRRARGSRGQSGSLGGPTVPSSRQFRSRTTLWDCAKKVPTSGTGRGGARFFVSKGDARIIMIAGTVASPSSATTLIPCASFGTPLSCPCLHIAGRSSSSAPASISSQPIPDDSRLLPPKTL